MLRSTRLAIGASVLILAGTFVSGPAAAAPSTSLAPLLPAEGGKPTGGYIVVLKPGAGSSEGAAQTARLNGAWSVHRYSKVLTGFSAELPGKALDAVRADPSVAYVRADSKIKAIETTPRTGGGAGATQTNPPSWGLDRIDQRNLPLNNAYTYDNTGTGATAYVVDTGLRATHADFGTRAQGVYNAVDDANGTDDCHGHGTHVAGTIAGTAYGVAKNAQIRGVRVLDCLGYGTNADLIEGMDWIATNAPPRSIANFSLQHYGTEVNAAAERLIDAGVLTVFIGGNDNSDACNNAPRATRGLTVGASTNSASRAPSSNYDTCLDLYAPGNDITSAGHTSHTAVAAGWSGTSMAAPHVAGYLARYLEANPTATFATAKAAVLAAATTGVVTDAGAGSPNRLLYAAAGTGPVDTTAPTTPGTPAVSAITATSATAGWAASTDNVALSGYQVERAVGSGAFTAAGAPSANSLAMTGLTPSTQYRVRVRAVDTSGNTSAW